MSLILNIDCATALASISIHKNGECIAYSENDTQKEHASFLHPAIQLLLNEQNVRLEEIDAFAITHGPGSYTGLRVSMATAKGFCMSFHKPLICINTLQVIAFAARMIYEKENEKNTDILFCPMIDARRMEVFTTIYNYDLEELVQTNASIVNENFIDRENFNKRIIFCGNGAFKANEVLYKNDIILLAPHTAKELGQLSTIAFTNKHFADTAYSEPLYVKEFYFAGTTPNV